MIPSVISIAIFTASYIFFIFLPRYRTHVAVCGAGLLVLSGVVSFKDAFSAVNWNVMGIFVGMLAVADIFMESRVPAYVSEIIVGRAKNTCWAILFICLLTGFISAFVENVATVLIVAPIALSLAKKLKISPLNMMIAIAVSSNLQGAATLVGDPPSMLLGGFAGMNFMDFFFYKGRPGIFFAVELGALVSFFVLYFIFRPLRQKAVLVPVEKVRSWTPTVILVFLILALAAASFCPAGNSCLAGAICMLFGALSLLWKKFIDKTPVIKGISSLDWQTTFFLIGVFILVGGISLTGWIGRISDYMSAAVSSNIPLGFALLVVVSVVVSAFVDNVPYLAAMLPVAVSMAAKLGINPPLLLFGLLIGASIGGNITPIGASANIVACGLLKKEGHTVGFRDFAKIGLPFTIVATLAASLFIWFVWAK